MSKYTKQAQSRVEQYMPNAKKMSSGLSSRIEENERDTVLVSPKNYVRSQIAPARFLHVITRPKH